MFRPIAISLSPNTELDDSLAALLLLIQPWRWISGAEINTVNHDIITKFSEYTALGFESGRGALYSILSAFGVTKNDEVIVQAFTCIAVPNSILWTGAVPVYADINCKTFNIDVNDLENKITKHTKAIIVQHTFGIPCKIDTVKSIAQKHKILLIEDCAHSLGSLVHGQLVGTFGDASIISFGRDKVISSVFGGFGLIHKKHDKAIQKFKLMHSNRKYPSRLWIFQQLLHPILFNFIVLPTYHMYIGKLFLYIFQKLKLLSFPISSQEKIGMKPNHYPRKLPNSLAILAHKQMQKLDRFNRDRVQKASYYGPLIKGSIYIRYPKLVNDRNSLLTLCKKQGILLGNWYHNVIDPKGTDFSILKYKKGSCKNAEYAAEHIINLPTYPTLSIASVQKIAKLITQNENK